MNVGIILLLAVILCAGIEALIGVKRGIALTGVRIVLWVIGTVVAAFTAKGLANFIVRKVAASYSIPGKTIAEISANALNSAGMSNMSGVLGVPVAGLVLSAAVPVAFVLMFIVMKLVTLGLYFIAKAIIKKSKAAESFTDRPVWSKIAGGVVEGVAAIIACAIIASPVSGLLKKVNDAGAADSVFHIMEVTVGGRNVAGRIAQAAPVRFAIKLEKQGIDGIGIIRVYAADGDEGVLDDIREIYDSVVGSPAEVLCQIVGGESIAMAIYEGTSEVTTEDVGAQDYQEMTYSFPATVEEVMGVTENIDTTVTLLNEGAGLTSELVDSVEGIVNYALDTELFSDEDKLYMLNASVPAIQSGINNALGLEEGTEFLGTYDSLDDFRQDVGSVMEIAHVVADSDIAAGGLANVDVNALMADPELAKSFIHSAMQISTGPEIITSLVNSKVNELSKGKVTNPVSVESISNAGEDKVVSTFSALLDMTKYLGQNSFTDAERADIDAKAAEIESYGVISHDSITEVKGWIDNTK